MLKKIIFLLLFITSSILVSGQKIEIGGGIGLQSNFRNLKKLDESQLATNIIDNKIHDQRKLSPILFLQSKVIMTPRFALRFGLNLNDIGYKAPDALFKFPNEIDNNGNHIGIANLMKEYYINVIEIPIGIQYRLFQKERFGFSVFIDSKVTKILSQYRHVILRENQEAEWTSFNEATSFDPWLFGLNSGFELSYQLTKRWKCNATLLSSTIYNIDKDSPVRENISSLGLTIGIMYGLGNNSI